MMEQVNVVMKAFIEEINRKEAENLKLKGQIVAEANKDVKLPQ
jgi:hypothetical protein